MDKEQTQEWEVLETKISKYSTKKMLSIKFREGLSVSLGTSAFQDYDELLANAKVMVAAPKLLKELSNLVECWDNDTFQDLDIDYAREAIKQATS